MTETPMKQCTRKDKCIHPEKQDDGWLPKTSDYFYVTKTTGVFASRCKFCFRENVNQQRSIPENREQLRKRVRDKYASEPEWRERRLEEGRKYRNTSENYKEYLKEKRVKDALLQKTPQVKAKRREWDRKRRKNPAYMERRRKQERERKRERRRLDPSFAEKLREAQRRHYQTKPNKAEFVRVYAERRRARKRSLPDTLTHDEWQRALAYFGNRCAVCERVFEDAPALRSKTADHWIPLSSPHCPGTVATNIVPLCGESADGSGGCNHSKGAKLPDEWLKERYGDIAAAEILNRIEAYFAWVRQQTSC